MKSLLTWLDAESIEHEIHEHARSLTASATARAEKVDRGPGDRPVELPVGCGAHYLHAG